METTHQPRRHGCEPQAVWPFPVSSPPAKACERQGACFMNLEPIDKCDISQCRENNVCVAAAHRDSPSRPGKVCMNGYDDPKHCEFRECARTGLCYRHLPPFKEIDLAAKTQGPILDEAPSEKASNITEALLSEPVSLAAQMEIMTYVEDNTPLFDGLTATAVALRRLFVAISKGTIDEGMARELLDQLSELHSLAGEIFDDIYDIVENEPQAPQEQETMLHGPNECGRGLPMAECISAKCDARCEIEGVAVAGRR